MPQTCRPWRAGSLAAALIALPVALSIALMTLAACGGAAPPPATIETHEASPAEHHHHELHLPPVGPSVSVSLGGKAIDVALASARPSADVTTAPLLDVWKRAFPSEDAAPLHFDLFGSDGFHPASRPVCTRLLTGAEMGAARIDVVTHDVSFDDTLKLPGCYRVKAVVRIEASR